MTSLKIADAIVVAVFTICLTIIVIKMYSGRCKHEWEEKERFGASIDGVIVRKILVLRCKKCGKLKNHEVN